MKTKPSNALISLLICLVLAISFLLVSILNKPQRINISTINYEEVNVKVIKTQTREIKSTKYNSRTYYDVTLEYEGEKYTWTSSTYDPKLLSGMKYDFILYNGKMYRNIQELQSNLTIINSSFVFKATTFLSVASFTGVIVCIAILFAKKQNHNKNI